MADVVYGVDGALCMLIKRKDFSWEEVILTIDPGITGTGVIAWNADKFKNPEKLSFDAALFNASAKEWEIATQQIANALHRWTQCSLYKVKTIYVEFPQAFQSALGQAAINRGDIFKLVFLIGCIRGVLIFSEFVPVRVIDWKGQLPKEEVERRCKRIIPEKDWVKTTHLWDAVGIGLYLKGKL
jgi:hypothetical protein